MFSGPLYAGLGMSVLSSNICNKKKTKSNEPGHYDFQQCGILTSVDSDEPVHPPFKLKLQMVFSQ